MNAMVILAVLAGGFLAAVLVGRVMATRIDDARRFAQLVADTRRLRARHRASMPPARTGRR
jgi:hypothetical protein